MRSYIDENDKKNEIRLLFKHPLYKGKVIIVVEGMSDVRLFRGILNGEKIRLETIDGKGNLISAMKELVGEFPDRILAVCDADHDHLTGKVNEREKYSIYLTDQHDAEVMMLNSPALASLIDEYSSPDNAEELHCNLLEVAFSAAYPLGLLRWVNTDESLGLKFKGLNFNQFIDVNRTSVKVDVDTLIDELLKRSPNKATIATKSHLIARLHDYQERKSCKFQVSAGHDLTNIISIVYRQRWASLELNMDHKKIESSLRIAYSSDNFKDTALFKNLSEYLSGIGVELGAC
jgi:hypothetical protein